MPTLAGLRRRGYTPEAIRDFCARIGVAKKENVIDVALLEHSVREDLNRRAPRAMAVLRPLKVVIENYPEGQVEERRRRSTTPRTRRPARARCRSRASSTSSATTSWRTRRRSSSGCRRAARCGCATRYIIKCERVIKDAAGEIVELRCTYDPESLSGLDGRAAREGHAPLGVGGARASTPKCGSTIVCSRPRIPARADAIRSTISIPSRSRC